MKDLKKTLEMQLIGNMIIEWCRQKREERNDFFFDSACSTQTRIIRFSTKYIESLFPCKKNNHGCWKNGHFVFYEVENSIDYLSVNLSVSNLGLNKEEYEILNKLRDNKEINLNLVSDKIIVKKWVLDDSKKSRIEVLSDFFDKELLSFEDKLSNILNGNEYHEGTIKELYTNVYERNLEARKKCIEIHGTTCKICGFSFEKTYGKAFKDKIEVHHIVPLHQIKKSYVVNPVTDLLPVCPNCHMILHSKKNGVYTPEEVKEMLNNN